ncbi:hypothetical protein N806_19940 [Rhodococcus sp. P27]|nr:hypothetical protein N806_19940 [Rhodococcus sp. P27]
MSDSTSKVVETDSPAGDPTDNDTTVEETTTTEPTTGNEGGATTTDDDDPVIKVSEARKLRRENQQLRQANQEAIAKAAEEAADKAREEARAAAEQQQREFTERLGKELGILPAEDKTEVDPAEVVAQAKAKADDAEARATAQTKAAAEARRDLALYRAADDTDADAVALLDSLTFRTTIAAIDPDATDLEDQLKTAIENAIAEHPRLRKPKKDGPARSGADLSAGNGDPTAGEPKATDIDSLRVSRRKRRDAR